MKILSRGSKHSLFLWWTLYCLDISRYFRSCFSFVCCWKEKESSQVSFKKRDLGIINQVPKHKNSTKYEAELASCRVACFWNHLNRRRLKCSAHYTRLPHNNHFLLGNGSIVWLLENVVKDYWNYFKIDTKWDIEIQKWNIYISF